MNKELPSHVKWQTYQIMTNLYHNRGGAGRIISAPLSEHIMDYARVGDGVPWDPVVTSLSQYRRTDLQELLGAQVR